MNYGSKRKSYENVIQLSDILSYQLDIWQWILGFYVNLGDKFSNPFRIDTNPDCFLEDYNGTIKLIDFGDYYNGTRDFHNKAISDIIQWKFNCSYKEALQIAFYEALKDKILTPRTYTKKKKQSEFKIISEYRNWGKLDRKFWNGSTGITSNQLESEQCFATKFYWYTNREGKYIKVKPKSPVFENTINNRKKLYGPKDRLFLTNFKATDIGGFKEYNDKKTLWFVSNLKSTLCMHNIDENCHYFPNEGLFLDTEFIKYLDKEFDHVNFLLDNNEPGLNASKKLQYQWLKVTGNTKGQAKNFDTSYYEKTYTNAFNQQKRVEDPYDVCKKWSLERLSKEINKL